jgi:hypothetical protein
MLGGGVMGKQAKVLVKDELKPWSLAEQSVQTYKGALEEASRLGEVGLGQVDGGSSLVGVNRGGVRAGIVRVMREGEEFFVGEGD